MKHRTHIPLGNLHGKFLSRTRSRGASSICFESDEWKRVGGNGGRTKRLRSFTATFAPTPPPQIARPCPPHGYLSFPLLLLPSKSNLVNAIHLGTQRKPRRTPSGKLSAFLICWWKRSMAGCKSPSSTRSELSSKFEPLLPPSQGS